MDLHIPTARWTKTTIDITRVAGAEDDIKMLKELS